MIIYRKPFRRTIRSCRSDKGNIALRGRAGKQAQGGAAVRGRLFRRLMLSLVVFMQAVGMQAFTLPVYAGYAAKPVNAKQNITMPRLTLALQKKIAATTPGEPASSDLELVRRATRLSTRRVPQGYTSDGDCYYFLSCMAFSGKAGNNLRLTRVRYRKDGSYKEDYMTLKGFGHGTNLDCVRDGKTTWLWTGSDPKNGSGATKTISCFRYKKGSVLKKHAKIRYKIPLGARGYAANTYPAISSDGSLLAVRYTNRGKQIFRVYRLSKGHDIDTGSPLKTIKVPATSGDFQGFDIEGNVIYTVEGTASRAERKELGKTYHPIRIRTFNYTTGKKKAVTIKGAKKLSHREPEGIQVTGSRIDIGLASHYKDQYTCMNVYRYRPGISTK